MTHQKTAVESGTEVTESRPPLPPFTLEAAVQNVRLAEDGWTSRDPEKVALAYTLDSCWRNRSEFITGKAGDCCVPTTQVGEGRLPFDQRNLGECNGHGLMQLWLACINDLPIPESERKYRWPL